MELWPRFPTPLLGSWKKSSLIGSLAVSFTLNIKVKHKSQASVLAKEGRACSSSLGWDLGPPWAGTAFSHSPALQALPAGSIQHQDTGSVWPGQEPPLPAQPGHVCPSPPHRQHFCKANK